MRDLRSAYELREKYSYNNQVCIQWTTSTSMSLTLFVEPCAQMYMLGAHIVEKYSGLTYPEFVAERLLKPLDMSTSTLSPSEAASSGLLTDTWTKDGRRTPFWFTEEDSQLTAGPGGVISSARDMVSCISPSYCLVVTPANRSNGLLFGSTKECIRARGRSSYREVCMTQ